MEEVRENPALVPSLSPFASLCPIRDGMIILFWHIRFFCSVASTNACAHRIASRIETGRRVASAGAERPELFGVHVAEFVLGKRHVVGSERALAFTKLDGAGPRVAAGDEAPGHSRLRGWGVIVRSLAITKGSPRRFLFVVVVAAGNPNHLVWVDVEKRPWLELQWRVKVR